MARAVALWESRNEVHDSVVCRVGDDCRAARDAGATMTLSHRMRTLAKVDPAHSTKLIEHADTLDRVAKEYWDGLTNEGMFQSVYWPAFRYWRKLTGGGNG